MNNELNILINDYGDQKARMDSLKASCNDLNSKIKDIMQQEDLKNWETDTYKATFIIKQNQEINEERMIALLKQENEAKFKELKVIKTKEYIDSAALENAVYNGEISAELLQELDKCSTPKPVPTLTVKKKKKKGE